MEPADVKKCRIKTSGELSRRRRRRRTGRRALVAQADFVFDIIREERRLRMRRRQPDGRDRDVIWRLGVADIYSSDCFRMSDLSSFSFIESRSFLASLPPSQPNVIPALNVRSMTMTGHIIRSISRQGDKRIRSIDLLRQERISNHLC